MDDYSSYVPWVIMAANGLLVGWLAGLVLGRGALIRDIFLGIIGAFIGGSIVQAGVINIPSLTEPSWVLQVAVSSVAAIALVLIARLFMRAAS